MKLIEKVIIKGQIIAKTGLHVGGSKSSLDIGGIDLNVIKTPQGVPFIPGSSLKGKIRSLLARTEGSFAVRATSKTKAENLKTDEDVPYIIEIFGSAGDNNTKANPTRILVRDAMLCEDSFSNDFAGSELETDFTDVKWENSIDRKTGTAEHPRQLERVPAGAIFNFEIVYDVYDDNKKTTHLEKINQALQLLQDDYIGGHGSRGYGKIEFVGISKEEKTIAQYAAEKLFS